MVETVVAANPAAEEIAHVVYNVQNVEAAVLEALDFVTVIVHCYCYRND